MYRSHVQSYSCSANAAGASRGVDEPGLLCQMERPVQTPVVKFRHDVEVALHRVTCAVKYSEKTDSAA
jgi:hypothetical protein